MKLHKFVFLTISLFSVFAGAECLKHVGALDVGSGTIKMLVAEVDTCQKQWKKVVFEESVPMAFKEDLDKSPDKKISQEMVTKSIPVLKDLVKKMKQQYSTKNIYAVATSVFRTAENGKSVINEISESIEVPIEIITQEKESELAYWAALVAKGLQPNEKVIVWDIGGGSMQMYSKRNGSENIFNGDLASVSFKNKVIGDIQKKDPKVVSTPNPLNKDADKAVSLARVHSSKHVPHFFKSNNNQFRWIGIGGVLSISVQNQIDQSKNQFTLRELEKTFKKRSQLDDSQIDSEYRSTEITNMALVLGYMKQLRIKKIETAKVNLAHGLVYFKIQ